MRLSFVFTVAALGLLTLSAKASPLIPSVGLFQAPSMVEQARTVCRLDPETNRRVCRIDRSQPPTVCHWVRDQNGNLVRDCY